MYVAERPVNASFVFATRTIALAIQVASVSALQLVVQRVVTTRLAT